MLDRADYSRDWQARLAGYKEAGLADRLVTTDDLGGVRQEKLHDVVGAVVEAAPAGDPDSGFSLHHYCL